MSVLVIGILLFLFRRIVQDGERPHWREETPTMPDAREAALLAGGDAAGVAPERDEFEWGGCGRPLSRQNPSMEGSKPAEFEVEIASAISAPEAFGASFDVAPSAERSSSARGSRAIPRSRSDGRSACSPRA